MIDMKQGLLITGLLALLLLIPSPSFAAFLNFDPEESEIGVNETTSIAITIDSETKEVAGTDIYVIYDASMVSLQSVSNGEYFPLVSHIPSTGRVYVSGVIANPGEFKTGTGTVATVVFKALKAGSTQIKFECDLTKTETSKINQNDINATNIINCSKLNTHTITVGGDEEEDTSADATPSTLPQSGVFEDMLTYSSYGLLLLAAGLGIRLFGRMM